MAQKGICHVIRIRPRLALVLALVLLGALASTASADTKTVYRTLTKTPSTGLNTIYQTFNHPASSCSDASNAAYSVQMSLTYRWSSGTTVYIRDVSIKYSVTQGRVWADTFMILPANGGRWPANPAWQGQFLGPGAVKYFYYHPRINVARGATLQNQSFYDAPGVPNSCNSIDQWVVSIYS